MQPRDDGGFVALFFLVCSTGMALALAADIGTLLSGTMLLFVALPGWLFRHEGIGLAQLSGFAVILVGAVVVTATGITRTGVCRSCSFLLAAASI